ncbi:ATP-binding protein [Dyadobacter frigoris]|uniref:HD domain-containing protein n=1 Tax=Dyadobacter frigoris TaxID=2576211 RepID=UPI0024A06C14|nr:ATP-binding protein [Dyadobacter frigoris]GLU57330.1 ATP-binding protein [Dyadobacter frigoris]
MVKYLEDLLFKKTVGLPSEILYAQWNFDKVLIPQALQSVSNIFPHYSLHDESHSITIVSNIVRILGKEVMNTLSATDIWLILEAAYSHDLGMVPSGDRLMLTLQSENFIDFFNEISGDSDNPLSQHAEIFHIVNGKFEWKNLQVKYHHLDSMRFLFAEYFRRKHAELSEEIINDPQGQLSLSTPRVVVPQRIWKTLGKICSAHMKDFEDVMNLSFSEVGLDLEYAHPRFVACMLRLGDLLDLDNNRFSDVMLRTLSEVPVTTHIHRQKHLSIETFQVDTNLIDIVAKCQDYESAEATQFWFGYLDSEISNQTKNWKKIAPSDTISSLPIIERLVVELKDYEYIDGRLRPQFTVDTNKTLELLRGAGIYSDKYEALREVIQNSIDATLICLWEEFDDQLKLEEPSSPIFERISNNKPVSIDIESAGTENGKQKWHITIEDLGTGISIEDLKFLSKTGSSSKNKYRVKQISKMPKWLKPSGAFGIGFQSIFMLTDKVTIKTKSIYSGEYREIELHSTESKLHGAIYLKKLINSFKIKNGTILTFDIHTDVIPESIQLDLRPSYAKSAINTYDFFTYESLDIEIAKLVDALIIFSNASPIPINIKFKGTSIERTEPGRQKFNWYHEENGVEFNISLLEDTQISEVSSYYKGQKFESKINLLFLDIDMNLHQPSAIDVLTINREKVNQNFKKKLEQITLTSLFGLITKNFDALFISEQEKVKGSLFLHYYFDSFEKDNNFIGKFSQWKSASIEDVAGPNSNLGAATTLGFIYDQVDQIKIKYQSPKINSWESESFDYDSQTNILTINLVGPANSSLTTFLLKKAAHKFKYLSKVESDNEPISHTYSKHEQDLPFGMKDILKFHKDHEPFLGARIMIPCLGKYKNLELESEVFIPYAPAVAIGPSFKINYPKMVSPYIFPKNAEEPLLIKSMNEKLFNWVYDNRRDGSVTKEQIVKAYNEFCKEMEMLLV